MHAPNQKRRQTFACCHNIYTQRRFILTTQRHYVLTQDPPALFFEELGLLAHTHTLLALHVRQEVLPEP
jgi:hypothetical protein